MSSPATIAEKSDKAQPGNTLLIIPDGSPLWTAPKSDDTQDETALPVRWQSEAVFALMDQLPGGDIPVLIGAPTRRADELLDAHYNEIFWNEWRNHLNKQSMIVAPRFSGKVKWWFGSNDPDAARVNIWFVTKESFDDDKHHPTSRVWASTLRRLGFDVQRWTNSWTLTENLAPKDKKPRIRNAFPDPSRPTSITVGTLVDLELVTTQYALDV
ncbi:MAG TPA: hypothetical protein VJ843_04465 [Candidatus Saccharimonadales bacterium]|nr:hypothetical protein [Candidatus Saccharimonadales bacterium]